MIKKQRRDHNKPSGKLHSLIAMRLLLAIHLGISACGDKVEQDKTGEPPPPPEESNASFSHPENAVVDLNSLTPPTFSSPHPSEDAYLVATIRLDHLLAKAQTPDSLLSLAPILDLNIPEALAGLLRDPEKLGIDLSQPIHLFVESAGDANHANARFFCATAGITQLATFKGQINFFELLGMNVSKNNNFTLCQFAEPALAFVFDDKHFALCLSLDKAIDTDAALTHAKGLFAYRPASKSILDLHLSHPFDFGFYLRPEGADLAPSIFTTGIARIFPSATSMTSIDLNPGEIVARFNSFTPGQAVTAKPQGKSDSLPVHPSKDAASLTLSFDGNTSSPLANFAFHDLLHSMWSIPFSYVDGNATRRNDERWVASWTGSSQGADGSYLPKISIPGHDQGDSESIDAASWKLTNTELTGITFAAKIDCRQAVSSLRSVPEPAAWRYDLVNTFEKLDRLSWSGTLFESTLAVSWRDRKTNGLTSLLTLIHQWQGEREGSELYTAIDRDDFDAFKIAMESAAAHLLDPESHATPLHFAARKGHVDMVRYILEKGIDVDARDSSGRTPLYAACWSGQPNVVQALLEQNASVDVANANGATPVMVASRIGHAEIVEILLDAGAKLNATDQHGQGLLEYAAAGGRDAVILLLQERNATVRRPLHLAAGTGDLEKLKILLAAGREVDEKDGGGGTALLFAASAGKWKALNLLLGEGADPLATDDLGLTLIHAATVSGNEKVLQRVLELHSQTNARHKQHGSTPLDWAIAKKDQVLTEMLRAKGGKTSWELGTAQ